MVYKPTYNWGAPSCRWHMTAFQITKKKKYSPKLWFLWVSLLFTWGSSHCCYLDIPCWLLFILSHVSKPGDQRSCRFIGRSLSGTKSEKRHQEIQLFCLLYVWIWLGHLEFRVFGLHLDLEILGLTWVGQLLLSNFLRLFVRVLLGCFWWS